MLSWLEFELRQMPSAEYLTLYGVGVLLLGFLVYYAFAAYRRFRFMDGTATSKIRSAPQGHVELKGLGEWLPNGAIASPFSNSRCVWYHCTIDKRRRSGKRTTWTNISDERSGHLFRLVDDTGECVVDPDDAHVIAESDQTWYGNSAEAASHGPGRGLMSLGLGRYRFRERLIRPATQIYALGAFHTVYSNPSDEFVSRRVEDLVKQWKLQPQRYLGEFDLDGNRKIQRDEWPVVRAAARKQVLAEIAREQREHHVLSRPLDPKHPYILSAVPEESLVMRKKLKAYLAGGGAFLIFSALVVMYSIRAPLPL